MAEDDTGCRQELAQASSSLGGGCAAVPVMHPGSEGSWLLSHKELVGSVTVLSKPGLHHKTNGGSGTEAAEESELLAVAEDDPTRSAEAHTAGDELSWPPHHPPSRVQGLPRAIVSNTNRNLLPSYMEGKILSWAHGH